MAIVPRRRIIALKSLLSYGVVVLGKKLSELLTV
jgi:hypothetical protein